MSNTGFVDVATAPAGAVSTSVSGFGTFAALTSPAVAADGTVVLGTLEGKVVALHPDGSAYWDHHLPGKTITTSPVVGRDGSVYVVGVPGERDHRAGMLPPRLYRFTPGGALTNNTSDFPIYGGRVPKTPQWIGAPNVWRFGDDEAIFVPAMYPTVGGTDMHLMAFSPDGGIMADWTMYWPYGPVTEAESWNRLLPPYLEPTVLRSLADTPPPFPGVTISYSPQGGTPWIVLVDRWNRATIAFTFCVGASCSPAPGFTDRVRRSHAPRTLWSSAAILADNHSIVGTDDGVVFGGPAVSDLPPIRGLKAIYPTPTVAADGRVVVVNVGGEVFGLRGGAVISHISLSGQTIARAAASRTHVFVATTEGLHTLDAGGANSVVRFPLVGGIWPPAVGPQGHVYAMTSNVLFVFPPPGPSSPVVGDGRPGSTVVHPRRES
jgi:outer membrane protein assembly factor BamB